MKLKFNEVKYSYRFNKGSYESEEIGLSAQVEDGNVIDALETLKDIVHGRNVKKKMEAVLPKEEKKNEKPAKKVSKKVEEPAAETKVKAADTEVETKKETKKKVTKKKTTKKKKVEVYDRTNDAHKKRMSEVCNELFGNTDWRRDKDKIAKIKHASQLCDGEEDFIGSDGEVLEQFKEVFKELIEA